MRSYLSGLDQELDQGLGQGHCRRYNLEEQSLPRWFASN